MGEVSFSHKEDDYACRHYTLYHSRAIGSLCNSCCESEVDYKYCCCHWHHPALCGLYCLPDNRLLYCIFYFALSCTSREIIEVRSNASYRLGSGVYLLPRIDRSSNQA